VAAIDFARTMPRVMTAKSRFVTDKVWFQTHYCFEIRSENIGRLEEGIGLATRALQIAKNNPNVMGHLSALYSLRSNLDCMNQPVYEADMKMARTWDSERKRVSSEGKTTFFEKSPAAPPPMPDN
jgi:hypothetical protein